MREYDFHEIEPRWQDRWEADKAYRTEDTSENRSSTAWTTSPILPETACMWATAATTSQRM